MDERTRERLEKEARERGNYLPVDSPTSPLVGLLVYGGVTVGLALLVILLSH